jgi:outer membrane immunogenic protein
LWSAPAVAADISAKAPVYKAPAVVMPAAYRWSGFYVGANLGYGWGDQAIERSTTVVLPPGMFPTSLASDPRGVLGGIQAGYNYQSGPAVFGVETDIAYADISRSGTFAGSFAGTNFSAAGEQKLDWFGTLRGRIGYLPSDRWLVYATGGLAYGHGKSSTSSVVNAGIGCGFFFGCGAGSASGWLAGWTAGAGLEWAFADRWRAKAEYLYYDLGSLSYSYPDTFPGAGSYSASTNFRGNIFRLGVNYAFN